MFADALDGAEEPTIADRFSFALALPLDSAKLLEIVQLHNGMENAGENDSGICISPFAMVERIAANHGSPAAGTLLGVLQLAAVDRETYLRAESRRWIQYQPSPGSRFAGGDVVSFSAPSLIFGPAVMINMTDVVLPPRRSTAEQSLPILVPNAEVDWTVSAAASEPPHFLPNAAFVPFEAQEEGAYVGEDRTGVSEAVAAALATLNAAGNPCEACVSKLSLPECARLLTAILGTPQIHAKSGEGAAAAAKARNAAAQQRMEEEIVAQQSAAVRALTASLAAGGGTSTAAAAPTAPTAPTALLTPPAPAATTTTEAPLTAEERAMMTTEAMTEKDAEIALKAIPASIRRAAVSDLKKRGIKWMTDLESWNARLSAVRRFVSEADAAGITVDEFAARRAAERGDAPDADAGCVVA
tara:strand:- start:111 stop:1352 length:1242 start_codon:yes stop_codon:yes gene_type:complete